MRQMQGLACSLVTSLLEQNRVEHEGHDKGWCLVEK